MDSPFNYILPTGLDFGRGPSGQNIRELSEGGQAKELDLARLTRIANANEKRIFIVAVGTCGMRNLCLQRIPVGPG